MKRLAYFLVATVGRKQCVEEVLVGRGESSSRLWGGLGTLFVVVGKEVDPSRCRKLGLGIERVTLRGGLGGEV